MEKIYIYKKYIKHKIKTTYNIFFLKNFLFLFS